MERVRGKPPIIAISFLGSSVIKCKRHCVEQMMSPVIVRGVKVSDENKHTRENHTMVIYLYIYGTKLSNCPT